MLLKYAFLALIHSQLPFQKVYNISICIFDSTVQKKSLCSTLLDEIMASNLWSSPNLSIHILDSSSPFKSNLLASISRINLTSSHHLIHSSCFRPLSFLVWINKIASISHFSFPVVMLSLAVHIEALVLILKCLSVHIILLFKSNGFYCFE